MMPPIALFTTPSAQPWGHLGVHCGLVQHHCSVMPRWNFTGTSQGSDYNPLCSQRSQDPVLEHL